MRSQPPVRELTMLLSAVLLTITTVSFTYEQLYENMHIVQGLKNRWFHA